MKIAKQLLNSFLYLFFLVSTVRLENPIQSTNPTNAPSTVTDEIVPTTQPSVHTDTSQATPPTPVPSTSKTPTTPTTADVCGLSLVSPNSENEIKQQKCTCSNRDEDIDCNYLDVTELPKLISFPKSARNVHFLGNKIENIAADTFYNGRNVLEMDLSHNFIDFISTMAFQAFKSLRKLDLSHNKIWNMPSKSFKGLTELKILNLGYNDMISISSDLFSETKDLRQLNLESNPLQELEPKLFVNLPHLEVLNLESTLLKVIPDHLFEFTPNLRRLDLSDNQLTDVPTDALKVLDRLKVLHLDGNPIQVIQGEAFHGMRGLVVLYLDSMPLLTTIEKYAFGDLQQLHELHCSYNFLLTEFDENAFVRKADNLKVSLSQLFLRQNSLSSISRDLLNWNGNIELHFGENPLLCDCNAEWMVNLRLKNDFQKHVKCNSPSYLADISLSDLKDHSLSCGMEFSEVIMIAVAVVVFFCILALVVAFIVWKRGFSGYRRPYWKVARNTKDVDYTGDDDI